MEEATRLIEARDVAGALRLLGRANRADALRRLVPRAPRADVAVGVPGGAPRARPRLGLRLARVPRDPRGLARPLRRLRRAAPRARAVAARGLHPGPRARGSVPARRGADRLGRAGRHLALPAREDGRPRDRRGRRRHAGHAGRAARRADQAQDVPRALDGAHRPDRTGQGVRRAVDPARGDPPGARADRRRRPPHAARPVGSDGRILAQARVPAADRLASSCAARCRRCARPRAAELADGRRHGERREHGAGRRLGGARGRACRRG